MYDTVQIKRFGKLSHINSRAVYTKQGNNPELNLGAIRSTGGQIEIIEKGLCSIFQQPKRKPAIEANKNIVDFLDISFDLTTVLFIL